MDIAYFFYFLFFSVDPSLNAVFVSYVAICQCITHVMDCSDFSQKTHAMYHLLAAEVSLRRHETATALL